MSALATGRRRRCRLPKERRWLRTGDVGELDAEGNLRFRGRKKNVIVTPAGLNVYPEDLEQALRQQAGVRDCVVVPDRTRRKRGSLARCLLMQRPRCRTAARATPAKRRRARVENGERFACGISAMRSWVVWPEADFPRTPTESPTCSRSPRRASRCSAAPQSEGTANVARVQCSRREVLATRELLRRSARADCERRAIEQQIENRTKSQLARPRGIDERAGRALPGGAERNGLREAKTVGDVERLLRAPAARRTEYAIRAGRSVRRCAGSAWRSTTRWCGRRRRFSGTRELSAAKICVMCAGRC